jgi:hypothetical protein
MARRWRRVSRNHVGQLVHRLVAAGARPLVSHEALALLACDVDEGAEQREAVRVLHVADVLAVELGLDRVHHHARVQVVDPEVLRLVVAQCGHGLAGGRLGLLAGHVTRGLLGMGPGDHAMGDFHVPARRVPARLQGHIGLLHGLPGQQHEQRQQEDQRDDRGLGGELEVAEQPDSRRPHAVVGEEAFVGTVVHGH